MWWWLVRTTAVKLRWCEASYSSTLRRLVWSVWYPASTAKKK
jgi:hypothetical protein